MRGDPTRRAVFLQTQFRGGKWLALLFGDSLDFPVHLVAGRVNRFALGDLREQQGGFDFPQRLIPLRLFHFVPVEFEVFYIHSLGRQGSHALLHAVLDLTIDEDLGLLRVARLVSAVDAGRILNQKTARSQIIGATVMGIGMTMLEETVFDSATGRIANATFGDYLIPVNADVPDLDVVFVGEPDRFSPIGIKGLGEIGIVGVSAAIANAVYHATGRRIRSLPITIGELL